MSGGTLMVSRARNLFSDWTEGCTAFGFRDVLFTDKEKDALARLIREFKPRIMLIGCGFYSRATPYMAGLLIKEFPDLNIAAVNIHEFPDDLASKFIYNGVRSYVNLMDGKEEFSRGMTAVRDGKSYISPGVADRINLRKYYPSPAGKLTDRLTEVVGLLCAGYKEDDVADTLHISRKTVDTHKKEIYKTLNVRNAYELYSAAISAGIISSDSLGFYPRTYMLKPFPDKKKLNNQENL